MSKHSEACCRIPPIVDEGYEAKGTYIELNGTKTYVTGPADSDKAILSVYDIFGFFPQTIQGADILANGDAERKYQVYIPDLFEGNPARIEWYPPTDDEKKAKLGQWFEEVAVWPKHIPKVIGFLKAAEKNNPNIKSWGIIGYCWGGKMASILAGSKDLLFKVAVQTSPAMIDAGDAANVKIPTMMLISEEEAVSDVKTYEESLKVPKHIEIFEDQVHGFMSARADLKDSKAKAEYERGYKLALGNSEF
ncbi:alpha/beta-hydrolase [Hypoxylon fuscum]|nr:alpha/beta-hydrolase [Hypoxylon fuscum]